MTGSLFIDPIGRFRVLSTRGRPTRRGYPRLGAGEIRDGTGGVPFGIQVIRRRWHDERLLAITEAITDRRCRQRIPGSAKILKDTRH